MAGEIPTTGYDVILIGCGKMGSALGKGLIDAAVVDAGSLYCCDRDFDRAETLAESTGATAVESADVFDQFANLARRIFVVAVKPSDVQPLLERGRSSFSGTDTIVSIAAGVPTVLLEDWAGTEPALVRAMPNTPALIRKGITGVLGKNGADMEVVTSLFGGVGSVVELDDEDDFDALTAISGSGPAYVFVAIEALADGGVAMGLDRDVALELAVETIAGSGALASVRGAHPGKLKDEVASPGGTTITGLTELERKGFRSALIEAVRAAAEKSEEMRDSLLDD